MLLALSAANAVLFFIENVNGDPASSLTTRTPEVTVRERSHIDLSSLNLFGKVKKSAAATQVVDAPETKLNLELQGVFTSANKASSTAIVAEKNKAGALFHVGDRLPGNAVLSAVNDDHILIRRGSRTEKLMFSDPHTGSGATIGSKRTSSNQRTSSQTGNKPASNKLEQVRERIAQRNRNSRTPTNPSRSPGSSLRDYMSDNRDKIQQDPGAVLADIGVSPVSDGDASGYKVSGEVSQTSLMRAGLQQGDVILSVNGRAVGNVMNDRSFIDQAMASKRVRVEVQRGSRKFFLTVPVP